MRSPERFDAWAKSRGLRPLEGDDARLAPLVRDARILSAEDGAGTDDLRRERFGEPLAKAFRSASTVSSVGRRLVLAPLIAMVAVGVLSLSIRGRGQPDYFVIDVIPLLALLGVVLVGMIVSAVGRQRMRAVAGALRTGLVDVIVTDASCARSALA